VAKTQQDVSIYKDKSFSTSQSQFEKDLKKRQREGWRLVSVTPTKKRGFGRIVQLTAIYEKDVLDSSDTSAATSAQAKAIEETRRAENKAQVRTERRERFKEAQRRAREKEQVYRNSLSPEQLQQYLKRKRRKTLIVAAVVVVALILGIAVTANNSAVQTLLTSVPTDTPVPTTAATPAPTQPPLPLSIVQRSTQIAQNTSPFGSKLASKYDNKGNLTISEYFDPNGFLNNGDVVIGIKSDCFQIQQAEWQAKPALAGVTAIELVITSQLQDKFGNTSTGTIGTCTLTKSTEQLFNWGNLDQDTAWGDYDNVYILPSLNS